MDKALRQELLALKATDIRVREELARAGELEQGYHPRMEAVHRENAARLREIIAARGWPGHGIAGEDGAEAAWLIVQHAIGDPGVMRSAIPLLEQAVEHGEAPAWQLHYLLDRVACFEGRPQPYGIEKGVGEDRRFEFEEWLRETGWRQGER
jgi:hypothetical protein